MKLEIDTIIGISLLVGMIVGIVLEHNVNSELPSVIRQIDKIANERHIMTFDNTHYYYIERYNITSSAFNINYTINLSEK